MKLNKFLIGGLLAASMGMTSCVGDLDLLPTNPNDITSGDFSQDPEAYMRAVMADVYLNISSFGPNGTNIIGSMDGGMSTFQRAVFNLEEVPTDEANWQPTSDAVPNALSYGVVSATETFILGTYQRMMVASSLCNQFIQTDFQLQTEEQLALKEEFDRQCKILRCGMYFYLISDFGNVPLNDENVAIGDVAPQLSTNFAEGRRLVTQSVVNTLEDLVDWYKQNDPYNDPPYGYVGLDVAEALLVKFYLNYEVFTGTPAWDKCLAHAQSLISRRGNGGFQNSGLAMNYAQCFSYNNRTNSAVNEIIWRIPQVNNINNTEEDPINGAAGFGVVSWANGGFMLNGFIGDSDPEKETWHCRQATYNSGNGWKCMSARRQFVEVFDWNANYTESPDQRVVWWKTAKDGFDINNEDLTQAGWGKNGFLPVKFTNWYIDDEGKVHASKEQLEYTVEEEDEAGNKVENTYSYVPVDYVIDPISPTPVDVVGIDYGMIRLAEIYLSAAEAILHGVGNQADAVTYVNYIRARAGMPTYTSLNLTELQNERQRELYTECTRRTDLIRYGLWISGYTWNWKGGSLDGQNFNSNLMVYPMPSTVVNINGYTQNPGW